jgi:hypothetical protein
MSSLLRSTTQSLSVQEGRYSLTIYPLIEGSTGVARPAFPSSTGAHSGVWLKQLHTSHLPTNLMEMLAAETYGPSAIELVRRVDRAASGPHLGEESRSHAARILLGLFVPGEIVELALASGQRRPLRAAS